MTRRPILTLKPKVSNLVTSPVRAWTRSRDVDADAQDRKRFYDSSLWQKTRDAKLNRDPLCQYCSYRGQVTEARDVDHYTPLAEGGHATADENLVSACVSCHAHKTMCERNHTPFPRYTESKPRMLVIT
jgi:5-methylcytosine-specific restriction endonuclease McrA